MNFCLGREASQEVEAIAHFALRYQGFAGLKINLVRLEAGASFGEMELIDIQARSANVTAVSSGTALTLRNHELFRLYHDDLDLFARLVLNLAREISRRLRVTTQRLAQCQLAKPDTAERRPMSESQ